MKAYQELTKTQKPATTVSHFSKLLLVTNAFSLLATSSPAVELVLCSGDAELGLVSCFSAIAAP
jgi:hypothetical protein